MAGTQGFMLVIISVGILSLADFKEANVTCVIQDDCILPCSFRPTGTVVIHWYKQQIPVHSYYYNKDQFGLQNKHFSGRTCLFNSQIPHGNASLLLKRVKVQDKGRYKCYTSTKKGNHENFINLEVKALIQSVNIEITAEMVFCSSQYIYPVPQVAWATDPPPTEQVLNSTTRTIDHKGLFTVESTLRILGNRSDHTYICTFTSADKTQVWIASRKNQEEIRNEEGHKFSIPCIAPHNLSNFTLTWTFSTSSETAVICRYDSRTRHTFNHWEGQAELDQDLVLEGDGSLWLLDPEVQEHTGTYTCTFSALQSRRTIQTNVNITVALISEDERSVGRSWWSTVVSVGFVVFTISVAHCRCLSQRAKVNRAVSRQHNGANVTCSGTQESFNATASRITGPHSADAITPQTHLQTQDVLEADMPETEENGSLEPHSEMSTDQEEHIRPVNHEHHIADGALGSAEFRLHIVPGTCAQDLKDVKLTDCENMHGQEFIV